MNKSGSNARYRLTAAWRLRSLRSLRLNARFVRASPSRNPLVGILGKGLPTVASRPVQIVNYDANWAIAFRELSSVLSDHLGELALRIEHVGSTSVPGLPAKPIIDMTIVILNRSYLPKVIEVLSELGYHHRGDIGVRDREAFGCDNVNVPYTDPKKSWPSHHLYCCHEESMPLVCHVQFRDYLQVHAEDANQYGELKRKLAAQYGSDREGYTNAKTGFIESIMERIS